MTGVRRELYLYTDFQVFEEDLVLRSAPDPPSKFPKAGKEAPGCFYGGRQYLEGLKTGDLVFFQEYGAMAGALEKLALCPYTRVAMVLMIPGINIPFIYDSPPFFMASYQVNKPIEKFLEGRVVTLESYLQTVMNVFRFTKLK